MVIGVNSVSVRKRYIPSVTCCTGHRFRDMHGKDEKCLMYVKAADITNFITTGFQLTSYRGLTSAWIGFGKPFCLEPSVGMGAGRSKDYAELCEGKRGARE